MPMEKSDFESEQYFGGAGVGTCVSVAGWGDFWPTGSRV